MHYDTAKLEPAAKDAAEARREYMRKWRAKRREERNEVRKAMGLAPAKPGRPRLCEKELLERRHERQRRYYETVVGHEVTPRVARKRLTDEERRAKWRERYYARMQKQGKTVTPRQKLTDMERLELRRARQRKYQAKVREQARKWKELKAQAVREGLQDTLELYAMTGKRPDYLPFLNASTSFSKSETSSGE